jgi:hypothetical protein
VCASAVYNVARTIGMMKEHGMSSGGGSVVKLYIAVG